MGTPTSVPESSVQQVRQPWSNQLLPLGGVPRGLQCKVEAVLERRPGQPVSKAGQAQPPSSRKDAHCSLRADGSICLGQRGSKELSHRSSPPLSESHKILSVSCFAIGPGVTTSPILQQTRRE